MNISCLIIEDHPKQAARLTKLLKQQFPEIGEPTWANSVKTARERLEETDFALVIADVNLGDGIVFDALEGIQKSGSKVVFSTSYADYAVDAFKLSAIGYLLKPYTDDEFTQEIRKTLEVIRQENYHKQLEVLAHNLQPSQQKKRLILKNHDLIHVVELDEILYAQADNNYTHFFCEERKILVSKSLKTYEAELSSQHFFRCHHSYLVNMKKVRALHKSGDALILSDNAEVPVASSKKKILYQMLG